MSNKSSLPLQTTLDVRDNCLCLNAQRAARALARRFDVAFRPLGITSGQFSLLMSLNRATAPTIGDVASTLAMDRTTLTAALKPLVARGLMVVHVDDDDRRGRRLALTDAGRDVLAMALPVWCTQHAAIHAASPGSADLPQSLRQLTGAAAENMERLA